MAWEVEEKDVEVEEGGGKMCRNPYHLFVES